ncbi:T9SS type A sorting domain-containing protein [uncultured Flavobacterium sp.]|uniref:T9SS type A sorting domain-containing protein n=1 Tax=uncultured Flavobacterium sp. TaxID=165435 RepID=UPI0030C87959
MKKTLLLLFLLSFTGIFAQGPFQPTQFNNVCDDNNDGFASFFMQEISSEIMGNSQNIVVTHHLTQIDAANGTNPLPNAYTNISNPQTIYARHLNTVTSVYQVVIYDLTVNPAPVATPLTLTQCDINGNPNNSFDLNEASFIVWNQNQSSPNTQDITYYSTQADAISGINQIGQFQTLPSTPFTLFYRVENIQTGCFSTSTVTLVSVNCNNPLCPTPTNLLITSNISNSVNLSWIENGNATQWEISVNGSSNYITTTSNPYTLSLAGLPCNLDIPIKVRSICSANEISNWSFTNYAYYSCLQIGQVSSLNACLDNGSACFDLTQNSVPALGNLNPSEYTVSYHTTVSGAASNADVITNPSNYCITTSSQAIYVRVQENTNPSNYETAYFVINAQTTILNTNLSIATLNNCDDDLDGQVVFDLTEAALNMNSPSAVTYYTSQANAVNNLNPIANPIAYSVGLQPVSTFIFARATYTNSTCETIFKINLKAFAVCNNAYVCSEANSLCNALGQPFVNTFQGVTAETGNNYACLNTQPNPTWFYLPVSSAGNLQFLIQQSTDINFGTSNLDVDYICYGPFASLSNACNMPMNNVVGCSYSSSATETLSITNAQPGQYYLIMVTNFSNQPGFIKITQTQGNTANIDCSGLNLNAFLDVNGNGTQDTGEINFPLGTFTYQLNNSGNNINVTSPYGEYTIFENNPANSYDVSYSVLPEYASYYNVTTSSYQDLMIVAGGGLQTYNFPVTISQPYLDVATYIVPLQQPRPGFTYKEKIVYANLGSQTIPSGTITFAKDPNVVVINNTQTGTVANAAGFTYDYSNLLPFEVRFMDVTMQVPTIPTVQLGQLLTNSVTITPLTGDIVPSNNANSSSQVIIGSYDPNDKMESRGTQILHSSFTSEDYLIYTIRFENTGTASAVNVRIEDVFDAKLDENSIRMLDASHEYTLERMGTHLTWYFDNIQLPVSVANTSTGKGYITFKVKPKPGYAIGDIIPNTANIYFDFNPAIVTNTFTTEFVAALAVETFNENNITMFPNPTKNQVTISLDNTNEVIANVNVIDMLGKQVIRLNKVNEITKSIDLSALNSGIYFIEIETQNKLVVKRKLIIN